MKPTNAELTSFGWQPGRYVQEKCLWCGGPCEDVALDCRKCRSCAVVGWRARNSVHDTLLGERLRAAGFGVRA